MRVSVGKLLQCVLLPLMSAACMMLNRYIQDQKYAHERYALCRVKNVVIRHDEEPSIEADEKT